MVFCSKCGEELPGKAYFCLNCGVRTRQGVEAGVSAPWMEELKESFHKMGQEIDKAFSIVGMEMEKAVKTAREKIQDSKKKKQLVCQNCEERNPTDAKFCYNCGKDLT